MKYTGKYKEMAEQFWKDGCDKNTIEKFIWQEMEAEELRKGEATTDITAIWLRNNYPDKAKEMWLHNAFCITCGNTSFKLGYNLRKNRFGVAMKGLCDKCGAKFARCCD